MPAAYRLVLCVLLACLCAGCAPAQPQPTLTPTPDQPVAEVRPELEDYFEGYTGAFALYDLNQDKYLRYNPERCAERFLPASTFKIMNSLIALETGVVEDENTVIEWDGTQHPVEAWNQDHTLKTAIQNSVVWYYQEVARRIGQERMQRYVEAARYGNMDISGQIDTFWLEGGLRISADEQVEFLKRLYHGDLPFSQRSMEIVKTILVLEKTDAYQLSGKTGSTQRVAVHTGWFVGYLEKGGDVYFFAANLESTNPDGMANGELARKVARNILQALGLL